MQSSLQDFLGVLRSLQHPKAVVPQWVLAGLGPQVQSSVREPLAVWPSGQQPNWVPPQPPTIERVDEPELPPELEELE